LAAPGSGGLGVDDAAWKAVYQRFGALPFNYYSAVDPHEVPAKDFTVGDLADDLADIWVDVKFGLASYQVGRADEAARDWRWSFDAHWGQHAVGALFAIRSWAAGRGLS
jgi:hypothetical protein